MADHAVHRPVRIGLYPGTFDPVTNGHLDVIERACRLVDHLVIAIGTHHSKAPMFEHGERLDLLRRCMEPIGKRTDSVFTVTEFNGLMVTAARESGAKLVLRGLRDTTEYNC